MSREEPTRTLSLVPAPRPGPAMLLHEMFAVSARRFADRVAVEIPPGTGRPERIELTYAELARRAATVAAALAPRVTEPESICAVLLARWSPHLVAAQLGVLQAGAAFTCIEPTFPDDAVRFVLEDSECVALLTDAAGAARAAALGWPEARVLLVGEKGTFPFSDKSLLPGCTIEEEKGSVPFSDATGAEKGNVPFSLAYVIYTSGTTGRPKGVCIEHAGIVNLVESDVETFALGPDDRVAQGSSPAYDSSLEETWLALAAGARVVVMDDEAARLGPDLVGWLRRERITVLCPPPTLLRAMGCEDPAAELPELRLVYAGGEALPQDLGDRWARGRRFVNGYWPTECTVTVLRAEVEAGQPVTIGRPIRGHRAWVLDEQLEELSGEAPGELCIAGPGVARGYLRRDELTADKFPVHPRLGRLYRTGDRVRRDGDGNFHYLGRIDDQVKLRGYRVELGAIDALLGECAGVRQAACAVAEDGGRQTLVAFVVPVDPRRPPEWSVLRGELARTLPAYMVPAHFQRIERLPTTAGGKLDRRALLQLAAPLAGDVVSTDAAEWPRDAHEEAIAAAIGRILGLKVVLREADFFLDVGGDSLRAAQVISELRREPLTAGLAVRDVYEARTVAQLAERARRPAAAAGAPAEGAAAPAAPAAGRPVLATIAQTAWLVAGLLAGSGMLYIAAFLVLPWLVALLGVGGLLAAAPALVLLATLVWLPVAVLAAAVAKRLLIGRYVPLVAPVWGSFYVRHWMVQQMVRLVPWGLVQDTVLHAWVLRALGARIGKNVHLHRGVDLRRGGWDMLQLGDDVTVAQDAALRLVELQDGCVVVAPVFLADRCTVEVRAGVGGGAQLGEGAQLAPLSWLPPGSRVPAGERWDGVPAQPCGAAVVAPVAGGAALSPRLHAVVVIGARFLRSWLLSLPLLLLAMAAAAAHGLDGTALLGWLAAPAFDTESLVTLCGVAVLALALSAPLSALAMRALGAVRPGSFSRWSPAYVRVLLKTDAVRTAGELLSGTLLWPLWLRWAGMEVGRGCEISTIIDVVPETVAIGDESFFADGIYLSGPHVQQGVVTIESTRLGCNTFLGNHVVVPAGAQLPDGVLVGVCTVAGAGMAPGTSWFGHPAFLLPRREVAVVDRGLTHEPSRVRYVNRLLWELARFLLPVFPVLLAAAWFQEVAAAAAALPAATFFAGALPAITLAAALLAVLVVLALKWLLLGRVRPGQHALWSCWCSRWDFLYVAWGVYAHALLASLEGTLLLAWYLRAMGMRIGRRVVLGSGFAQVVDPDMLRFDDGATVACVFQAHSFEDRVLKIGRVRIGAGASAGFEALLFYGAEVGEGARVTPHSVVMKHERLLAGLDLLGVPDARRWVTGHVDGRENSLCEPVGRSVYVPGKRLGLVSARALFRGEFARPRRGQNGHERTLRGLTVFS